MSTHEPPTSPVQLDDEDEPPTSPDAETHWVVNIQKAFQAPQSMQFPYNPSIFMASSPLRGLKHDAFIPQVVSIGPYHCDIGPHHSSFPDNLETVRYKAIAAKEMEKHKIMASLHAADSFCTGVTFFTLVKEFLQELPNVRREYDADLACTQNDKKLAHILALDACFLVQVLRCNALDQSPPSTGFSPYYCSRFPRPLRKSILQDFVLLENQIPLFLLIKVIKMDKTCALQNASALNVLASLFIKLGTEVLPFHLTLEKGLKWIEEKIGSRKHLLDCLYAIVTHEEAGAHDRVDQAVVLNPTHFPRAVDLHNSGIRFRGVEGGNPMEVRYERKEATLHVSKIRVGDDTERFFRNLIAYESHLVDKVHVLSYLRFMNNLVDTPEDVALLIRKGIITQDIGSDEEVAKMWNNLCLNTMRVCSKKYDDVAKELVKHCDHKLNAWKAEFKRDYLSRPWLLVSLLSGASLLLMTFVIMFYTIELFDKPGG